MIHRLHGVTIYIAAKVVDLRKGHDGLAASVQSHLRKKPFDGAVHVFRAKWADRLKLIYWDGTGLGPLMVCKQTMRGQCMAYKRLEQHAFKWSDCQAAVCLQTMRGAICNGVLSLNPAQFESLFAGLEWRRVTQLEVLPPAVPLIEASLRLPVNGQSESGDVS
ncbi:MAG: transposase, partial [bacterium]